MFLYLKNGYNREYTMLKGILSLRGATRYYFYHVIFEWENALSEVLSIPIKRMNPFRKLFLQ